MVMRVDPFFLSLAPSLSLSKPDFGVLSQSPHPRIGWVVATQRPRAFGRGLTALQSLRIYGSQENQTIVVGEKIAQSCTPLCS